MWGYLITTLPLILMRKNQVLAYKYHNNMKHSKSIIIFLFLLTPILGIAQVMPMSFFKVGQPQFLVMGEAKQMLAVVLFKSNKISQAQLMDYTGLRTPI